LSAAIQFWGHQYKKASDILLVSPVVGYQDEQGAKVCDVTESWNRSALRRLREANGYLELPGRH